MLYLKSKKTLHENSKWKFRDTQRKYPRRQQAAGGLVISEVVVIVTDNCSFSAMFEVKTIRSKGISSFLPAALEVY